jgi:hypothetical protein
MGCQNPKGEKEWQKQMISKLKLKALEMQIIKSIDGGNQKEKTLKTDKSAFYKFFQESRHRHRSCFDTHERIQTIE